MNARGIHITRAETSQQCGEAIHFKNPQSNRSRPGWSSPRHGDDGGGDQKRVDLVQDMHFKWVCVCELELGHVRNSHERTSWLIE